jgi:flagellar hook assembly protein FlgD
VTRLRFGVTQPETVHLAIYDVTGRRVRTLRDEILRTGVYEDVWDGRNESGTAMASGIYFARLKVGEAETVRKLVVAK